MSLVAPVFNERADTLTMYPSSRMEFCTRCLVESRILPVPLITLDTVLMETPECLATSLIVTLVVNRAPYQSVITYIPNPRNST